MLRKRLLVISSLLVVPVAVGLATYGCSKDGTGDFPIATVFQVTDANTAASLPKGPDAIGGRGSGTGTDIGDYVIANQNLRAVIDEPGTDPNSQGGLFPLANVLSPGGGTLVDLASNDVANDNLNQMAQAVVGLQFIVPGAGGSTNTPAAGLVTAAAGTFTGVVAGDTIAFAGGANDGLRFRIAAVNSTSEIALFVPPPLTLATDAAAIFAITRTTSPLNNIIVYDSAAIISTTPRAVLRLTGGVLNSTGADIMTGTTIDPATGRVLEAGANQPLTVETDYILNGDDVALTIETRVTNPGAAAISLFSVADLMITGGTSVENLAVWTPLAGFTKTGLTSPIIVPFVAYQGRGDPGSSYACVDPLVGQMIHASGDSVAANIQVSTSTDTAAGGTTTWNRKIVVGRENAIASAADFAIQLLANSLARANPSNPSAITTIPNMYSGTVRLSGNVINAPPGTRITAQQVSPALTFDPGAPTGATGLPGFYPTVSLNPAAVEMIINQTRPGPTGEFDMLVPARFSGLSPDATAPIDLNIPPNVANGTSDVTYRVVVEAPGMIPQTVVVDLLTDAFNNLTFDLSGQLGVIDLHVTDDNGAAIPCRVTIVGVDPDGPLGPLSATPNPTLGTPPSSNTSGTADESVDGTGNVVFLLDGRGQVRVPAGNYQVIADRGIEYSADRFPAPGAIQSYFTLAAGSTVTTETSGTPMQLTRLLDSDALPGITTENPLRRLVSTDFHVHAGGSFDSVVSSRDRVISFLGRNVEVLISTEHDNVVDLASAVTQVDGETTQNVDTMMATQIGTETTGFVPVNVPTAGLEFPNTIGHYNSWPVPLDPSLRRNGAPADEYRPPALLYEQIRALNTTTPPIIQMNHPRFPIAPPPLPPLGLGFFTNSKTGFLNGMTGAGSIVPGAGGYNTPIRSAGMTDLITPRTTNLTTNADFDVFEIYNGEIETYELARMDWYAMLSAGLVRTATANSDSHTVTGGAGLPRNFAFASLGTSTDASTDVGSISATTFNADVLPTLVQGTIGVNADAAPRTGASGNSMEILGSSGPVAYIEIDADEDGTFEAQPGDYVEDDGDGTVDVRVTVLAAPWVPVDTVTLIINGGGLATLIGQGATTTGNNLLPSPALTIAPNPTDPFSTTLADVVRVRQTVTVSIAGGNDDWIALEARSTAAGATYDLIVPNSNLDPATNTFSVPIGFCNPIFVSDAADNTWTPNSVP